MRFALASSLAALVWIATTTAAGAATPILRVGTGPTLAVVGSGFAPKTVVRIHIVGTGVDRRASIRAGATGTFVFRFAEIGRCSVEAVTATTASGARTRVPRPWFIRECPPPPPLAPGVYGTD